MKEELRALVGSNEKILYEGKPNKRCYIFESIFNIGLPLSLVWAILDFYISGGALNSRYYGNMSLFFVIFGIIHMMPVWLYLVGIILTVRRYKNTTYIVTDRAIYVSSGIFTRNFNTKSFAELSHINLHRGIFDQIFRVGDIIATTSQLNENGRYVPIKIASISNYVDIYNMVKKLQTDIYTDVMYPNAKRPSENSGYNTEYKEL